MSALEQALRDDLEPKASRAAVMLDLLKRVVDNWPPEDSEECGTRVHPRRPALERRRFPSARDLWIQRENFAELAPKGFFRLYPGNRVRLRYGYIVECTGREKDTDGNIVAVHAGAFPDLKSGTRGAGDPDPLDTAAKQMLRAIFNRTVSLKDSRSHAKR